MSEFEQWWEKNGHWKVDKIVDGAPDSYDTDNYYYCFRKIAQEAWDEARRGEYDGL